MRELLQQALEALNWTRDHHKLHSLKVLDAINDIEAALSRSKWVKVSDGLPVVPEGAATARIWLWRVGTPVRKGVWCAHFTEEELSDYTHWQYRQYDTPAPPDAS